MSDQADKLRELVHREIPCCAGDAAGPAMIVVTGGKGGVGTTTVAVNLAAALADTGQRTVLVDASRQHADIASVAGIDVTFDRSISDVLAGRCTVAEALVPGPKGTLLLAGRWAPRTSPDCSSHPQLRLLAELAGLDDLADVVVVDTGSGASPWTRRFWQRARVVLVVTTPDDVAVMDTYATIKQCVADARPPDIRVLANQCSVDDAAGIHRRVAKTCQRFLGLSVGHVPALARHDVSGQSSQLWCQHRAPFARAVRQLAKSLADLLTVAPQHAAPNSSEEFEPRVKVACG